jgi:hypothetical protein
LAVRSMKATETTSAFAGGAGFAFASHRGFE